MSDATKRLRSDGHANEEAEPEEESALEALRAQLMQHVDQTVHKAIKDFSQKTLSATMEYQKKQEQKSEKRLSKIEQDQEDMRRSQQKLEKSLEDQHAIVSELQKALAVAEAVIPIKDNITTDDFNRPVDCTILRVNLPEEVPKAELASALRPWLEEADCESTAKADVLGPDSGKRITIHFKGMAGVAFNRLKKARSLLRLSGGTWRSFPAVPTTAGGSCSQIYIDVDKNPCQQKRERNGKQLRQALEKLYPIKNKDFRLNRVDGLITFKGTPFALIDPQNDSNPSNVRWHLEGVSAADVDRDIILAEYRRLTKPRISAADVQWSG